MISAPFSHTPEQARAVLTQFAGLTDKHPVLEEYAELEDTINFDVRSALYSLIMQTGRLPRHQSNTLRMLERKSRLSKVQGIVHHQTGSDEPDAIQLSRYSWPYGYGVSTRQYAFMKIEDDLPFVSAKDGDNFYIPGFTTQEYLEGQQTDTGQTKRRDITGRRHTGIEIASREAGMAPDTLTGYLNTVLSLTKGLIET